jgi:hypothetical protein
MLVQYVLSDGISQAFLPFWFVDVIVITDHDLLQINIMFADIVCLLCLSCKAQKPKITVKLSKKSRLYKLSF